MKQYDIFISYRREGGAETAKHLRDTLTEKGYRVFLDIESLRSGQFNTALYEVIEHSKDILLILPAGGLDRCMNETDWVRLEIEHAVKCGKNIVPVFLKNFSFPASLPPSLEFLRTQNGITANTDYYDAFVEHLEKFLQSKHRVPKSKQWILALVSIVLVAAIVFGSVKYFTAYPHNRKQKNLVAQVTAYAALNFKREDLAAATYLDTLEEIMNFVNGKSVYSFHDVCTDIEYAITKIDAWQSELEPLSESLNAELSDSPFKKEDLTATYPTLKKFVGYYSARLQFFLVQMQTLYPIPETQDAALNEMAQKQEAVLLGMIGDEQQMCQLFAEELFYNINLMFVCVNVDSALSDFKSKNLPEMTTIYAKRLDFIDDEEALKAKFENLGKQEMKLTKKEANAVEKLSQLWAEYKQARGLE